MLSVSACNGEAVLLIIDIVISPPAKGTVRSSRAFTVRQQYRWFSVSQLLFVALIITFVS